MNQNDGQGPRASRLRERHADVTRDAILSTALQLFSERGYANVSVRELARAAGVAVQTIYANYGSKPAVLTALLLRADEELIAPIAAELMRAEDPVAVLSLCARLERTAREAAGPAMRMLRDAASCDPSLASAWQEIWSRHIAGVERMCAKLARNGSLREELTLEAAIATALALTSVEVYEETIARRGWTHDEYEAWLADALQGALLPRAAGKRRR